MTGRVFMVVVCVLAVNGASGQVCDTAWVRCYDGEAGLGDRPADMTVDTEGNVYVVGYCDYASSEEGTVPPDFVTIKYNRNGDTVWVRTYNGPADSYDRAKAVLVDDLGAVYVAGDSHGPGTDEDFLVVKYDEDGDTVWTRRYDGPGHGEDHVAAMALDGAGALYVFGDSDCGYEDDDYALLKYLPDGLLAWVSTWDAVDGVEEMAEGMALDTAGNIYVTGSTHRPGGGCDYATLKYDGDGNRLWLRWYDDPESLGDYAVDIAVDAAGNVFVTGYSPIDYWAEYVFATVAYNSEGRQLWVQRYDGPDQEEDRSRVVGVDGSGNVFIAGSVDANSAGGSYIPPNLVTAKYAANGKELWFQTYDEPESSRDWASDLVVDALGNAYVTGATGTEAGSPVDYLTIKYDPLGGRRWVRKYDGLEGGGGTAVKAATDIDGNVYVTGFCASPDGYWDIVTLKYRQDYLAGDVDGNDAVNVADVVYLIGYIFGSGNAPLFSGNVDCNDVINISDAVYLISYIFGAGAAPCDLDGDSVPDC